jgi:acyl carrier protein
MTALLDEVKAIVARYAKNKDAEITPGSTITQELDVDSLDFVQIVSDIEDRWQIEVSDDTLQDVVTIGDLLGVIESLHAPDAGH